MGSPLDGAGHLVRIGFVFVFGVVCFAGARAFLVPRSFGQFGHYRADAVTEIAAQAPMFAGHAACADCHQDVVDAKAAGKHAGVNCEACHGPLAKHAADPAALKPVRPNPATLCARCHEANRAKPVAFPQVNTADHSGGASCVECHAPHSPAVASGGAK